MARRRRAPPAHGRRLVRDRSRGQGPDDAGAGRQQSVSALDHALGRPDLARAAAADRLALAQSGPAGAVTDGLWNYAATLEEFGALLAGLPGDASAIEAARALTDAALAQGGQDNITVAVVDVDPAP